MDFFQKLFFAPKPLFLLDIVNILSLETVSSSWPQTFNLNNYMDIDIQNNINNCKNDITIQDKIKVITLQVKSPYLNFFFYKNKNFQTLKNF